MNTNISTRHMSRLKPRPNQLSNEFLDLLDAKKTARTRHQSFWLLTIISIPLISLSIVSTIIVGFFALSTYHPTHILMSIHLFPALTYLLYLIIEKEEELKKELITANQNFNNYRGPAFKR